MITNIGINVADCILDNIEVKTIAVAGTSTILDWLSGVLSLAVNMFATGLIAWKAWNFNHDMAEAGIKRTTRVQKILLLLIESGAVYCTIQAAFTIVTILNTYATVDNELAETVLTILPLTGVASVSLPYHFTFRIYARLR
ncbi:hypothetical protein GYMLUDRAFT_821836 [Collybiopsis luxurians FD-317 M1]|uniref:Uncharacterized protein n=1 Tax=Collybiopsis luxurians FD-317 M1 TaxID=944289 RepID=A0A0D0CM19_9AGAR|nr:hypothetical protein GYMLUDRAFT_821836 [Collybiopsis luxurians FD-317 M1]